MRRDMRESEAEYLASDAFGLVKADCFWEGWEEFKELASEKFPGLDFSSLRPRGTEPMEEGEETAGEAVETLAPDVVRGRVFPRASPRPLPSPSSFFLYICILFAQSNEKEIFVLLFFQFFIGAYFYLLQSWLLSRLVRPQKRVGVVVVPTKVVAGLSLWGPLGCFVGWLMLAIFIFVTPVASLARG